MYTTVHDDLSHEPTTTPFTLEHGRLVFAYLCVLVCFETEIFCSRIWIGSSRESAVCGMSGIGLVLALVPALGLFAHTLGFNDAYISFYDAFHLLVVDGDHDT